MRLQAVEEFLCIDLEATCWADDEEALRSETIEVGAVRYRPGAGIVGEHRQFVRPAKHPTLSAFCTELTGITQAQVDAGIPFPDALAALRAFAGQEPVFCSWSDFDREQLFKDCALHRLDYPFIVHVDAMKMFGQRTGQPSTLEEAVRSCGLAFLGRPHNGIDDARNLAAVLDWLVQREPRSLDTGRG